MDVLPYKGFEIHAHPYRLADCDRWVIDLCILRHREGETCSRQFSAGNRLRTREEAVVHCFHLGRQIINGEFDKYTVDDL